jgi:hypothetical protein
MAGVTMGVRKIRSAVLRFNKSFAKKPLTRFPVVFSLAWAVTVWMQYASVYPLWAAGDVPAPTAKITGPIPLTTPLRDPERGYPYNATPMDLTKHGYIEEEFFLEGRGSIYEISPGSAGQAKESNLPFKTRIVVRRPKLPQKFNGTVVVEWYNVSEGRDVEYDWFQSAEHIVRSGYAWAGVSAQSAGVNSLREWSPDRYQSLDVNDRGDITDDALSYDIFTAAGLAVRGKANIPVLGSLKAERLIAIGHAQSAERLYHYFHSVHPLMPKVFDAVVLHGGGGKVRDDLNVRVFKLLSETDVASQANDRQPDTDRFRRWEVAGTSHLDAKWSRMMASLGLRVSDTGPVEGSLSNEGPTTSGGAGTGASANSDSIAATGACKNTPFSRIPAHYVLNAVLDHTARWVKDGSPPPAAPPMEIRQVPGDPGVRASASSTNELSGRASAQTAVQSPQERGGRGPQGPRWELVRDEYGNAHGGIELSQHAVPTATNTGQNAGLNIAGATGGERNCNFMGSYVPWDERRLSMLYPSHAAYVAKVKEVTERNLKTGYIVKADADATIAEAERSTVGVTRVSRR